MPNGDGNDNGVPQPIRNGEGAPILGPRNTSALERENPDLLDRAPHRRGTIPEPQVLVRRRAQPPRDRRLGARGDDPRAAGRHQLAGVNMRLKPGGIRELHWHKEAEWAFMLAGRARITAIDAEGRNFIDDVGEGDLWNFPAGMPHSIQGLEEGCEFLLVFDNGEFSENETFLITDWFAHTPRTSWPRTSACPRRAFADIPIDVDHERYIFPARCRGPLAGGCGARRRRARAQALQPPAARAGADQAAGGRVRIVDSTNFPVATTIAAALVEVEPGGMRELHWHPNTDEWQYYICGQGRMTVFASAGKARTFDYRPATSATCPFAMGHYVENTGDEPLRFLEMFRSDHFADVSLNQWMALTPPELVQAHLDLDQQTMAALSKEKPIVVQREHVRREALPDMPDATIGVLTTSDERLLMRSRFPPPRSAPTTTASSFCADSRPGIARAPACARTGGADGDDGRRHGAYTAPGRARLVQDPMVNAPEYVAVALDVEHVDDHRQPAFQVDSGIGRQWVDRDKERAFGEVVEALRELAREPDRPPILYPRRTSSAGARRRRTAPTNSTPITASAYAKLVPDDATAR